MRLRNGIAILVCALVGIAGCTGRQPLNDNSPVVTSKGTPSEDEVRKALVTAASVTHWAATPLSSGWIVAERRTDGHSATVNIYYSAQHYSIALADTTMVDRPQAAGWSAGSPPGGNVRPSSRTVHRTYNVWVQELDRQIRAQLLAIGM